MRKEICILLITLILGGIFISGCNKKPVTPEIIPINQVTEVVEIDLGLEVGK